jgi:hypothetical protein
MERDETTQQHRAIGLCANCRYTRQLVSGKGSQFFYCTRAETDARYTKYPPLPVTSCRGYERDPGSQTEQ